MGLGASLAHVRFIFTTSTSIQVHSSRRISAVPEERWAEREEDRRPNELFLFQGFGEKQMRVYKQHLATMRFVVDVYISLSIDEHDRQLII